MSERERDLLASVYLDGEATPDEVAQVERDPELMARVETFRAVRAQVATPAPGMGASATKEAHLAAALDVFNSQPQGATRPMPRPITSPEATGDSAVVDLTSRRRQPDLRPEHRSGERLSLLAAAAGAMVLLVGGVFLASRVGGGSDADSVAMELTTDDAADSSEEAEAAGQGFDDAAGAAEAAPEADVEEAADDEAMEEEAVDSEAALSTEAADGDGAAASTGEATPTTQAVVSDAEQDFAEDDADEEGTAESTTTTLPDIRRDSLPDGGFFPQEPVVTYPVQPSGQDLVDDLTLAWRDPESSLCGATYVHPDNALLIAYLPIEITAGPDGQPQIQEALYFTLNNDVEVVLVVRDTCQPV